MSDPAPDSKGDIEWYKAFGGSPKEQLASFRKIMRLNPDYEWVAAEVSRDDGLVLHRRTVNGSGKRIAVRFSLLLCGYDDGIGPQHAVKALTEAGFGPYEDVKRQVYSQQQCFFLMDV